VGTGAPKVENLIEFAVLLRYSGEQYIPIRLILVMAEYTMDSLSHVDLRMSLVFFAAAWQCLGLPFLVLFFRSTLLVDLIMWVSNVHPCVLPFVLKIFY